MKFLKERTEIAKAINIDKIPVICFDVRKSMEGYDNCYEGTKVNIEGAHKGRYSDLTTNCTPHIWSDELDDVSTIAPWMAKRIHLNSYGSCLHSDFSLRDVEDMVEWSHAPRLHAEDKVIVFFKAKNPFKNCDTGYLRLMKVGKHIDPFCSTVTFLEDVEEG